MCSVHTPTGPAGPGLPGKPGNPWSPGIYYIVI